MHNKHAVTAKPCGWHSRRYLPHFDGGEMLQMITYHLGDALPACVMQNTQASGEPLF